MGRSSCNLLVARALPAEPGRIAGPLYWTSTCHPFLFIRHIAAPTFLRLRISALFVQILAQFRWRSEEHTSELQSLMRISSAVFCLKKKKNNEYEHKYQRQTQKADNYKKQKITN